MALVLGGIRVEELRESFSEGIAFGEGPSATKAFLVPNWSDRYTVANSLLGSSSYVVSGGRLTITSPGAYPDSPGMIARRISIKGLGAVTPGARQFQFAAAAVIVEYGVPPWQTPGGDPSQSLDPAQPLVFATQKIHFGGQWLTLRNASLKTASGPLTEGFGRFVGVNNISVTFFQFPYLPTLQMRAVMGKMNNAPFFGAGTGTLILTGIDSDTSGATDATFNQTVAMSWDERPEAPWDYTFTGGGSTGWEQVTTSTGGVVIKSADYTALIPGFYRGA